MKQCTTDTDYCRTKTPSDLCRNPTPLLKYVIVRTAPHRTSANGRVGFTLYHPFTSVRFTGILKMLTRAETAVQNESKPRRERLMQDKDHQARCQDTTLKLFPSLYALYHSIAEEHTCIVLYTEYTEQWYPMHGHFSLSGIRNVWSSQAHRQQVAWEEPTGLPVAISCVLT